MVDFKLIGLRIKERRFEEQITQAYLAEQAELSPQYLSQVEAGKKHISLEALVKVAMALHTTADDLLTGNQFDTEDEYVRELSMLLEDCSGVERRILFEMIVSLKKIVRENLIYLDKTKK